MIDFDANLNKLNEKEDFDKLNFIFTNKTLPLFLSTLFIFEYVIALLFLNENLGLWRKIYGISTVTR